MKLMSLKTTTGGLWQRKNDDKKIQLQLDISSTGYTSDRLKIVIFGEEIFQRPIFSPPFVFLRMNNECKLKMASIFRFSGEWL